MVMTLDQKIEKASKELETLRLDYKNLGNRLSRKAKRVQKMIEQQQAEGEMTLEKALVTYLKDSRGNFLGENTVGYNYLQKLNWIGFYGPSGYVPETNQYCMKLMLTREFSKEEMDKVEEKFSEYISALEFTSRGYKFVDIFEETCSQYGSYALFVFEDKFRIVKSVYGREGIVKEFTNQRECLEYIREYVYYNTSQPAPDRWEDDDDY